MFKFAQIKNRSGKKSVLCSAFFALLIQFAIVDTSSASAESGDLIVRLGIGRVDLELGQDFKFHAPALGLPAGGLPVGGDLDSDNDDILNISLSYFLTKNIAVGTSISGNDGRLGVTTDLAVLGAFDLATGGTGDVPVGSKRTVAPNVNLQYFFMPNAKFSPYVGMGVTYATFKDIKPSHAVGLIDEINYKDAWGYHLQAGFDYTIAENIAIAFAISGTYVTSETSVKSYSLPIEIKGDLDIDAVISTIGIAYRF